MRPAWRVVVAQCSKTTCASTYIPYTREATRRPSTSNGVAVQDKTLALLLALGVCRSALNVCVNVLRLPENSP